MWQPTQLPAGDDGDPRWQAVNDAIMELARSGQRRKALAAFDVVLERGEGLGEMRHGMLVAFRDGVRRRPQTPVRAASRAPRSYTAFFVLNLVIGLVLIGIVAYGVTRVGRAILGDVEALTSTESGPRHVGTTRDSSPSRPH